MSDFEERAIGNLTVRIDRTKCVGFAHCIDEAEAVFALGADDVVTFDDPDQAEPEAVIEACAVCPVEALTVFGADGVQLQP
jgi:ferredoxin